MTYVPKIWTPNVTPVGAADMNHIEQGIVAAEIVANKNQPNGYPGLDAGGALDFYGLPLFTGIFAAAASGDSQLRFQILNSGHINWGSGSAGPDVTLYWAGPGQLGIQGSLSIRDFLALTSYLQIAPSAVGANAIGILVPGDSNYRWQIDTNGVILWGPGNAAGDVSLQRAAAGYLQTDGALQAVGILVAGLGTPNQVVVGSNNAGIYFGSGADANLYRQAPGTLQTDGIFLAGGHVYAGFGTPGQVILASTGTIYFGASADANIHRVSAGVLRTDGTLDANALTVNGVPVGGSLPPQLSAAAAAPPGNDLNQIVASGWYNASTMTNAPVSAWLYVNVIYVNSDYQTQTAWDMISTTPRVWRRQKNVTWGAWSLIDLGGRHTESGYVSGISIPGQSQTDIAVTFTNPFNTSVPGVGVTDVNIGAAGPWDSGKGYISALSGSGFTYRLMQQPNNNVTGAAFSWIASGPS